MKQESTAYHGAKFIDGPCALCMPTLDYAAMDLSAWTSRCSDERKHCGFVIRRHMLFFRCPSMLKLGEEG